MIFYTILALCAFMISLLGTRLTLLALRRRTMLLDIPNLRSNHKHPTPKGGGIAVVFALVITLAVADISYLVIFSLFILTAISLLDDLAGVPVPARLCVQVIAVAAALIALPSPIFSELLPGWADKILAGLLWIWFTNLFNFMDGIDGISATEMIGIGVGLSLPLAFLGEFPHPLAVYSIIVASAGAGFFWWNWHPAKIFLGDVGSIPIGFILGYLLLLACASGYGYAAIILPAYYLADSSITLTRRLLRRQKIWVAHSEHYYQKAVRGGYTHARVSSLIFGVNLLLIFLATRSVLEPQLAPLCVGIAYFIVFILLGVFAHAKSGADENLSQ